MQLPLLISVCLAAVPIVAAPSPNVKIVLEISSEKPHSSIQQPTAEVLERYGAHITGGCEGVAWCKHYDFCYYGVCYDLPWWTMFEVDQSSHTSVTSLNSESGEQECYTDAGCGWREYCEAGVCYFAGYGYPDDELEDEPEDDESESDDCDPEFGDDCPCTTQKDCHPEDTCVDGWCFSSASPESISSIPKNQPLSSKASFSTNRKQMPISSTITSCDYHTDCLDDLICYAQACMLFSFTSNHHSSVKKTVEEYDNGCYVHYGCPDVRGAKVCGYHLLCEGVEVGTVKPAHAEG